MKINELLTQSTGQPKRQTTQQITADFSKWLDDNHISWEKLNTPTKQSSGDEYYWQHQTQLQQSELHFDAQPLQEPKAKPWLPGQDKPLFSAPPLHQETQPIELQNQGITAIKATDAPSFSSANKCAPLISELEQRLEQTLMPDAPNNPKLSTPALAAKDPHMTNTNLSAAIQFKNNHLFIHEEQAELTLNLHAFNKQEQNELLQLIQNQLKKKGLVLSRLIINGVQND